jgi:hypothetical protein
MRNKSVVQKKYPLNQAANEVFNGKTCPAAIYEIYSIAQARTNVVANAPGQFRQ